MAEGLEQRYRDLVAAGRLTPDPEQAAAVATLAGLARALRGYRGPRRGLFGFGRVVPPRGIYLHGPVGRGKSLLMDLFFEAVPLASKRRVHFHAFMQEVHGAVRAWREARPGDPLPRVALDIAQDAAVLCLDELQVTDIADAMILGRLFEALLGQGVVIVVTSNRAPDGLYKNGINRQLFLPFIALVRARLDLVHLGGPVDYRLARMQGQRVYFTPLGPEADAALDAAWEDLTETDRGEPASLDVNGRVFAIPEAARGVVRFGFAGLCEAALGPGDYLALARHYHALVLRDIPRMGPASRNAARRFVTLIDALYEHQVKLVCSAAAPPEALYPDGDGAFEFQRTVSRLAEMQSGAYLALPHAPGGRAAT